jgi:hypothetical protein
MAFTVLAGRVASIDVLADGAGSSWLDLTLLEG